MMPKMMIMDGLETERLKFRRLSLDDVETWREFMTAPEAVQHLLIDPTDPAAPKNWIDKQLGRYDNNLGGLCAVCDKSTGVMLGQCGVLYQELDTGGEWEVGYHFMPKFWGKGYATEAARAVKEEAFRRGLTSIISLIAKGNEASKKVAEKHGMVPDGEVVFKGFDLYLYRDFAK